MSFEEIWKRRNQALLDIDNTITKTDNLIKETERVINVCRRTQQIIDDLDEEFCVKTGLDIADIGFLFFATGLQICRQYFLSKFPQRLGDQEAAKQSPFHYKEKSDRHHRLYNPSFEQIKCNPVPFDALIGSNGALAGGGSLGHRATAIGHDPLLGLIIGTANIATSTLTTKDFKSYHIRTGTINKDIFGYHANLSLILYHTFDKLINQGLEGKKKVALSFLKELSHLYSDINTKKSLPVPILPAYDPLLASEIAKYGMDMSNIFTIQKQAIYAIIINYIISFLHSIICISSDNIDKKLHQVKTKKIILYSNIIASTSNIAVVALTKKFNLLDLGGIAVSIYELITSQKFIHEVKSEFISSRYRDIIIGDYAHLCDS